MNLPLGPTWTLWVIAADTRAKGTAARSKASLEIIDIIIKGIPNEQNFEFKSLLK